MATTQATTTGSNRQGSPGERNGVPPVSLEIVQQDVGTVLDFFTFNMALARDVLSGAITPAVCNAACHASGRALQVLDLQYRMGNKKLLG